MKKGPYPTYLNYHYKVFNDHVMFIRMYFGIKDAFGINTKGELIFGIIDDCNNEHLYISKALQLLGNDASNVIKE